MSDTPACTGCNGTGVLGNDAPCECAAPLPSCKECEGLGDDAPGGPCPAGCDNGLQLDEEGHRILFGDIEVAKSALRRVGIDPDAVAERGRELGARLLGSTPTGGAGDRSEVAGVGVRPDEKNALHRIIAFLAGDIEEREMDGGRCLSELRALVTRIATAEARALQVPPLEPLVDEDRSEAPTTLAGYRVTHAYNALLVEHIDHAAKSLRTVAWVEPMDEAKAAMTGDPFYRPAIGAPQVGEVEALRAWKAGATGAAAIAYPPRVGPHTKEAFVAHRERYMTGSEDYRVGADVVSAACAARDERAFQATPPEERTEDIDGVRKALGVPDGVLLSEFIGAMPAAPPGEPLVPDGWEYIDTPTGTYMSRKASEVFEERVWINAHGFAKSDLLYYSDGERIDGNPNARAVAYLVAKEDGPPGEPSAKSFRVLSVGLEDIEPGRYLVEVDAEGTTWWPTHRDINPDNPKDTP